MPHETKPGILRNLRVKRVALVDSGANFDTDTGDGAHIMLYKRAVEKDGPSLASVHVPSPPQPDKDAKKKPKLKETNVTKNLLKRILGLATESDVEKRAAAAVELAKAVDDLPEEVAKVAHDPGNAECKCEDCMAKAKDKDDKDGKNPFGKQFSEIEKANAELKKQNLELAKSIEVEKNLRLDREMTDILKSFKATSFDMTTDVAKFRKMKEATPEAFETVIKTMRAQDEQISQSALYKNIGSSMSGGAGGAWEQIEAKADQLIEKSKTAITREQAIEKVMLANPNLVAQHRAERS